MAFDPDAYLASKAAAQPAAFDPDAYLAKAAGKTALPQNQIADSPNALIQGVKNQDMLQTTIDKLRGFRDLPQAGSQMILHALPASVVVKGNELISKANNLPIIGPVTQALGVVPQTPAEYDKEIQNDEAAYQQRRQDAVGNKQTPGIDWTRLAGNIVSTAPIAAVLPESTGGLLARTGAGIAQGGTVAAFQPVTNGGENFAKDKAKQVSIGAATGGALVPITAGVSRIISPNVSSDVKQLLDAGVTPTPGQMMGGAWARTEDKLTSMPLLGDAIKAGQRRAINEFNTAAYNEALSPIGKEAGDNVGRAGVESVKKALSDAYDDLLPKLQFKADQQFAGEIQNLQQMAQQLPPQQANRFNTILQNKVIGKMTPQGNMDGITLKNIESELSGLSKIYKSDTSADQKLLGDALSEVLASIRGNLSRSNPQYADDLASINLGYANYARIRDAASRIGAEDGVFTPAQLQSAVRAGDKSAGKGNFATGNALMQDLSEAGKNVLGSKYPDSGTAGRTLANLAASGGVGAASMTNLPATLLAASPALAYTPLGQRVAAAMLARRPEAAVPLADFVRRSTPMVSAAGAAVAPSFAQKR